MQEGLNSLNTYLNLSQPILTRGGWRVRSGSFILFITRLKFSSHLMFVEQLQNVYRKAGTIPPQEGQEFAHFAYIAVAVSDNRDYIQF